MCEVDLQLVAAMLGGIGAFLTGIAAIFVLPKQLGFRRDAQESKKLLEEVQTSHSLMLSIYRKYMASLEGIVWSDYPGNDSQKIIDAISKKTQLEKSEVKRMLDDLKDSGKI